ncbi:MAG: GNAT family N-acetyltransferase [Propionibacteriaceae bacterium]|jgi:ribosomal-protein-alanine N-acetyltransferase|nr:GNAT family N-acetyltransferase [Propionibacteriaceae bacterium]
MPQVVDAPQFPAEHHWPVVLRHGDLVLTPFRVKDMNEVARLRTLNMAWLSPWEATSPDPRVEVVTLSQRARYVVAQARKGVTLPWMVRVDGLHSAIVGQCTLANIVLGSARTASLGYWIDQKYAGRSITPMAVALVTDYTMASMGLHRIEICIRPENTASLRVVEKLGFRYEGHRPRYIHIAGAWRDHEIFVLTAEEVGEGLLPRLASQG